MIAIMTTTPINRNGRTMDVTVQSGDRRTFLRGPVLH